jgi:hypothetical protein
MPQNDIFKDAVNNFSTGLSTGDKMFGLSCRIVEWHDICRERELTTGTSCVVFLRAHTLKNILPQCCPNVVVFCYMNRMDFRIDFSSKHETNKQSLFVH